LAKRARAGEPTRGELVILGSGLKAPCHLTVEALAHLRAADVVFGALNSAGPDRRWLEITLGKPVLDLNQLYPEDPDAERAECYVRAAEAVLVSVRRGLKVAMVTYGHPTVCDQTTELLARLARTEGHTVVVLPGISCVAALLADLGVDPASGLLVCAASHLLEDAALPVGPRLAHLVLLMPDAVGDPGTGAALASGHRSLADSRPWAALIGRLQVAYGSNARCVLYRAPVWASVFEASMLSVPLVSLRCRSFVDRLVRAWGGDLGTMYVAGAADEAPCAEAPGGAHTRGGATIGAQGLGSANGCASAPERNPPTAPAVPGPPIARPAAEASRVSGFDAEASAWLRRWGVVDLKDAMATQLEGAAGASAAGADARGERGFGAGLGVGLGADLGAAASASVMPPRCGLALGGPSRAARPFTAAQLASLRGSCTLAEAWDPRLAHLARLESPTAEDDGGSGGGEDGGSVRARGRLCRQEKERAAAAAFLAERAAWEPSDAAVALQSAYARHGRSEAPEAVRRLLRPPARAKENPSRSWSS